MRNSEEERRKCKNPVKIGIRKNSKPCFAMMPRFPLQISCQHRKEKYKLLTFSFFFLGKVRNYGGKESRGQLLTLHTGSLENGNKRERFFSCIIFSNFFSSGEGGNLAACIFPFFPTLKRGEGKKIFLPVAAAAKLCQIFLTSTTVSPPPFLTRGRQYVFPA